MVGCSMDSQSVTTTRPVSRETRARRRQRAYPWVSAPSTTAAVLLLLLRAITFMGSKASVTLGTVYGLYESAPVPDPSLGTFTATCIASDPGNAGVPFIGGYFTFSDNSGTAYFKVYKRRQGGDEIWTRTIAAPGGSQNLVLSCAADSSGNLYIATASTALTFDGKTNPVSAGIYGIFLSKLAGTSGDTIWTRALDYTSDGAGDALSIVWNHQANEVVLFGQMHNARRASKIPCLLRFEAVCGTFLSGVTVGAAENTLASRLAIGASGHIFVAGRTSVAVNNKQITCVTTGCFSCFLSIYTMNIHQQTAITSGTNECYGLALSADHQVYVNKVAVYMDVGNSNAHRFVSLACLYYDSTMLATILEFNLGSISTSIGAVFLQNDKILVTGVTSEEVYANRPTEFPATFIAEFSGKALQGIQFYSSSSIPGGPVENRISEMVWSSSLFKVMALMGKSHNAATGVVYAPKWLAVGSTIFPTWSIAYPVYTSTICPVATTVSVASGITTTSTISSTTTASTTSSTTTMSTTSTTKTTTTSSTMTTSTTSKTKTTTTSSTTSTTSTSTTTSTTRTSTTTSTTSTSTTTSTTSTSTTTSTTRTGTTTSTTSSTQKTTMSSTTATLSTPPISSTSHLTSAASSTRTTELMYSTTATTVLPSAPISATGPKGPDVPKGPTDSVLTSPIFWGSLGGAMALVIAAVLKRLQIRRRRQLLRGNRDKEQQFNMPNAHESSDALSRSTNMLFPRQNSSGYFGSPALSHNGFNKAVHSSLSSNTVYGVSSDHQVPVSQRATANKSDVYKLSNMGSSIDQVKSISRPTSTSIVMNAMPTSSRVVKPPTRNIGLEPLAAVREGDVTSFSQRTLVHGAVTGKSMAPSMLGAHSVIQKPTTPSLRGDMRGNTTIGSGGSVALSLTTTTIMSNQKVMSIPGFLEMQDGIDFTLGKELARGGGGAVYLGEACNSEIIRMTTSKQIVVKRVFEDSNNPEESDNSFFQEVAIMWLLSGRNIAKIVGFCTTPKSILMKFYPCGSLSDLIHFQSSKPMLTRFRYDTVLAVRLATDVACGVMEIHKEGLFHSDLKPPNILLDIDEQGVLFAVITDFGVTQVVKQNALLVKAFRVSNTAGISPCYGAPELLGQNLVAMRIPSIAQAADTFSFAVILAEIVTRTAPWNFSKSLNDVVQAVVIGERAYPRPLYFGAQDYHRDVASLVERCWAQAPRARPEMHAVYADLVEVLEKITGRK